MAKEAQEIEGLCASQKKLGSVCLACWRREGVTTSGTCSPVCDGTERRQPIRSKMPTTNPYHHQRAVRQVAMSKRTWLKGAQETEGFCASQKLVPDVLSLLAERGSDNNIDELIRSCADLRM